MRDKRHNEILRFINHFTQNGKNQGVIDCFTKGCCYWFAEILKTRFADFYDEHSEIYYDQIINHFGYYDQYTGRIYDVTGDVTDEYNWINFLELNDELLFNRIFRDCINFEERED